ncbi:MAG: WG repeat-containing protein [Clostridia bacterium]|nr:WG repeat-containing protein [Clostridia bacterium]
MLKGKIKWILIAIVAVIIICVVAILLIRQNQFHYQIEKITNFQYRVLIKNGKYGVIDKQANIVIEPIYDAIQIPNPSKPVFICMNEYDKEQKKYKTTVLNEKAEAILTGYENVQAIPLDTGIDEVPYEKSVLQYIQNGKYGLINFQGKKITEPIYDKISSIHYKEGTFLVKQEDKVGAINMKGTTIIKPEYETITSDNYYDETNPNKTTGFIVSQKTEDGYRYGYINYCGNMILKPEYTELERVTEIVENKDVYFIAFQNGQAGLLKNNKVILNYEYEDIQYNSLNHIFVIQRNGKQGAVTKEGNIIIAPEYDTILFGGIYIDAKAGNDIYVFDLQGNRIENNDIISMTKTSNPNYYIAIDKNDIYTIVDQNRNVLIDNNYTYIEYLPGDYFIVARDGKNGVINIEGKSVIDIKHTSIFPLNGKNVLQTEMNDTQTVTLYTKDMKKIVEMDHAIVKTYDDYFKIASDKDFAYYDYEGNKLEAQQIFGQATLFAKKINDKWGFVDKAGNIKVANEYDMVTDFNEYGYAGIQKDEKWGVIDSQGNILQEPIYELDWIQPTFLGKYYRIQSWYGDARYSDDIKEPEEVTED